MEQKNVAYVLSIIHTWDFLKCDIMTPLKHNMKGVWPCNHALIGALQQCEKHIECYMEIKWSNKKTI